MGGSWIDLSWPCLSAPASGVDICFWSRRWEQNPVGSYFSSLQQTPICGVFCSARYKLSRTLAYKRGAGIDEHRDHGWRSGCPPPLGLMASALMTVEDQAIRREFCLFNRVQIDEQTQRERSDRPSSWWRESLFMPLNPGSRMDGHQWRSAAGEPLKQSVRDYVRDHQPFWSPKV